MHMLSTKYVTKVSIIPEKITGCTGCTVDASCNNAVRHKEGNHRKEETRAMGKYLWRANSCDGRRVDASSSCNVANAGRHEEEKAASGSSTDPILSQPTAQLTSVLI